MLYTGVVFCRYLATGDVSKTLRFDVVCVHTRICKLEVSFMFFR